MEQNIKKINRSIKIYPLFASFVVIYLMRGHILGLYGLLMQFTDL